ncbi:MAG: hypothetical protein KF868_21175 [Acidobacteria bacterium]|nr:hypothetical protein [Acidobacteriota bacterium]MCW5968405.1 hypothetical protein [Blastocatellales bacterium]
MQRKREHVVRAIHGNERLVSAVSVSFGVMRVFFWVLIALCSGVADARAQYRFDHWTADNGLPQNSLRDIVQTRDGYLWFTTFDGLVRFDGVRFTVFNKSNSPGLVSNRFAELIEDRNGDLWATVETGMIVRLNRGRFTAYGPESGLPDIANMRFGLDRQGNLIAYDLQIEARPSLYSMPHINARAYRFEGGRFQPADELGYTSKEALVLGGESSTLRHFLVIGEEQWSDTANWLIRHLKGGGVRIYREGQGLPGKRMAPIWGNQQPFRALSQDAEGRLWLTDLESGRHELMSRQAPEGFNLWRGFADKEGNYWFATHNNGLFRARRQTVTPYGKAQGLIAEEVYPMVESRDGSLWIGTTNQLFRLKDGIFTRYASDGFFFGSGYSLYEDRAGRLWVDGHSQWENGKFIRAPWWDEISRWSLAWTMFQDGDDSYWFGSAHGVLHYLDGVSTYYTTKDGLAGNDTKVIIEDREGGLWIGSYGGLTHYKNGKFTAWTEKDGLPGNNVRALRQDADGALWIGTYDSGLGRFKDGRFTSYTVNDGLFDSGVFQILEDDYGWFWMSCNRGIYRVRKQDLLDFAEGRIRTLNSLAYNKSDGMPSSECNGGRWPAGVRTRDGKLWFPAMHGVAMIDPAEVKSNTQPPPVVIEGMRINNLPVSFDVWDALIHDPRSVIRILPGQDNFEIEYTALSFINSENMRFRYRLEGADHDWVEAGTRRTAYFSHLAPGDYTFRVIAANSDGVWNEAGASVEITIVPPFWRTWWFTALLVLGAVGALAAAWKYRVAQLRSVQIAQQNFARRLIESQEVERKRIAAELHDSLGQNLLVIKNRAMIGASTPPDDRAKAQFEEISSAVSQTLEEVRTISHDLRPPHLDQLGLHTALMAMIEKVEASSEIRFVYKIDEVDGLFAPGDDIVIYRIVQECLNNILKHSGATEAEIRLTAAGGRVVLTVSDNGRGFAAQGNSRGRAGLGLQGIAERARILGGRHEIITSPGRGATITVTVESKER